MLPSQETLDYLVNNITIKRNDIPDVCFISNTSYIQRPKLFSELHDVLFVPKDEKMEQEIIAWYDTIYNNNGFIWGKEKYAFSNEKIKHMFPYEIVYSEVKKDNKGEYYKTLCKFKMHIDWIVE
jgi:hypothetical protein